MRDSTGRSGRMSRVHTANTVTPVRTPTTSSPNVHGLPLA